MSKGDDSGQAFPIPADVDHARLYGLTKRELFAAMAMQGFCGRVEGCGEPEDTAEAALRYADALLEVL